MPPKMLLAILLVMLPLAVTFWAILDIPKRRFSSEKKKLVWFVAVSSLPFVGAVFYVVFVRRHTEPL